MTASLVELSTLPKATTVSAINKRHGDWLGASDSVPQAERRKLGWRPHKKIPVICSGVDSPGSQPVAVEHCFWRLASHSICFEFAHLGSFQLAEVARPNQCSGPGDRWHIGHTGFKIFHAAQYLGMVALLAWRLHRS